MQKVSNKIIALNIFSPIVLGAVIYYLISPEVLFVKQIDELLGQSFHFSGFSTDNLLMQFIRNHFLDMLWGYALVFALFFVLGNNAAVLWKTFLIAFSFSTAMEILQITPIAKGTFDMWDIIAEFLAEAVAVFIIKILLTRRKLK